MWNLQKKILDKTIFTNGQNINLSRRDWVKKIFHGVETNWLSGKENVADAVVSKEGHDDNLLRHVKSVFYSVLVGQTSTGRVMHCTVLVGCTSSVDTPLASRSRPPLALTLFEGVRFIVWRLRHLFRGMLTGPEAFLGLPDASELRHCTRTDLKEGLVPHLYAWWGV